MMLPISKLRVIAHPAFAFTEHACAFSYAVCEFTHVQVLLVITSCALIVAAVAVLTDSVMRRIERLGLIEIKKEIDRV